MLNYFLKKLESIHDGDATLLDRTVVLYGSGMSDGNVHNNFRRCPSWSSVAKTLGIRGNRHTGIQIGTPLSNLMLGSDGSVRRPSWRSSATALPRSI